MIDSISDLFTRIRNAILARRTTVFVPYNKINESLVKILLKYGFISYFKKVSSQIFVSLKYKNNKPIILQIKRLSRPGCRLYVNAKNIPRICGKLGIVFLSTSKGILSDREAYFYKLGGEIIGFVS